MANDAAFNSAWVSWPRGTFFFLTKSPSISTSLSAMIFLSSLGEIAKQGVLPSSVPPSPSCPLQYKHLTRNSPDATHIFDGLNDFPTHVAHLHLGAFIQPPTPWNAGGTSRTNLYETALQWLTEDRAHRRQLELGGRKMRGPRRNSVRNFTLMIVAWLIGYPLFRLHSRVYRVTRKPSTKSARAWFPIDGDWLTSGPI